jgi:RNA polymerase sigma factor (sigma-70 family)
MADSLEHLFRRYRAHGDTAALAEIFDRTAPRLLGLAIHLVGDVSTAEDLVQSTFVAAIEAARSFDSSRSLEPWLAGILTNRARELRRDAQREVELDRLVERAERTPLEQAQEAEFSGTLARAIDKLPEPYRRTLLLRLRHGMKPADIAHALGESPGAIRVRIHRGLEMLKQRLPAGFAFRVLLAVEPARGLASIKHAVVSAATAHVAAVPSIAILGGLALGKKAVAVVAAVVLLLLAWWAREAIAPPTGTLVPSGERAHQAAPVAAARTEDVLDAGVDAERRAPLADEPVSAAAAAGDVAPLRGKVVDGETGQPVAGALVRLYPPRRARISEIKRRWFDRLGQSFDGSLYARGSWPWLPNKLSDAAAADAEEVLVCDPPLPGTAACASAVTDAAGAFEFLGPKFGGFLVCESAGHETRQMPAPRSQLRSSIENGGEQVERDVACDELIVRMWRMRPLSGYVIGEDGKAIQRSFKLRFTGARPGDAAPDATYDPVVFESWTVETRADGTFSAQFAAPQVQAACCEADWELTDVGMHPTREERWVFAMSFAPGEESEPAILVARRFAALRVIDAATHLPIESIVLQGNGYAGSIGFAWRGRRYAREGRVKLVDDFWQGSEELAQALRTRFTFKVWADGYLPRDVVVENLIESPEVVVELERGELPALMGHVMDAGSPRPGASVALVPLLHTSWRAEQTGVTSVALCDAEGRFELRAPPGGYLMRCTSGEHTHCEAVTLPAAAPMTIDLARASSLLVHLRDQHGAPVQGYVLALGSNAGRSVGHMTDADGRVEFADLTGGEYTLAVAPRPGVWSWGNSQRQAIDLHDGEQRVLDLTLASAGPRFARLIVERDPDVSDWRARDGSRPEQPWFAVGAAGSIPIDMQTGLWVLELENARRQRWEAPIPAAAPDGFPIRIAVSERGYEGRLIQHASGQPVRGMRVTAVPRNVPAAERTLLSVVADDDGQFRIVGLEPGAFTLELTPGAHGSRSPRADRLGFVPHDGPSTPPRVITVVVPSLSDGVAERRVSGQVRVAGRPGPGIMVDVYARIPTPDGVMSIHRSSARSETDGNGSYSLTSPAAPQYHAVCFDPRTRKLFEPVEWSASSAPDGEVHDFELQ